MVSSVHLARAGRKHFYRARGRRAALTVGEATRLNRDAGSQADAPYPQEWLAGVRGQTKATAATLAVKVNDGTRLEWATPVTAGTVTRSIRKVADRRIIDYKSIPCHTETRWAVADSEPLTPVARCWQTTQSRRERPE
jgi:hypothetical protein